MPNHYASTKGVNITQKYIGWGMKRLCYLGLLREGFSAHSSPAMLISREVTKDKTVMTYFRCLNVRIAKNTLGYLLLQDAFPV